MAIMPNFTQDDVSHHDSPDKSPSLLNNSIVRVHKPPDHKALRKAAYTPWIAFGALFGAALTVFLILALLLAINGQPTWPPSGGIYGLVQPASVLSLLLSVSDILLAFGLAAGFEIAWSYQASKPDATIARVQDYYAAGSSTFSAVRLARRCFYLSVAVLLCALTPILGFILQGCITTRLDKVVTPLNLTVPIVETLDVGFSTPQVPGNYWENAWNRIWQQVLNVAGNPFTQYAYFGSVSGFTNSSFDFGYDNSSTYSTVIIGAGFAYDCTTPEIHFNLLPTARRSFTTGLIFSSSVSWVPQKPNEMQLNVLWKTGSACSGTYQTRNCTLRAARIKYPAQIQMQLGGCPYMGPFFSLQKFNTTYRKDRVVTVSPVAAEEGKNDQWTYRGIAESLGETFNSTVTTFDSFNLPAYGQVASTGVFGPSIRPSYLNPRAQNPTQGLYGNSTKLYYNNTSSSGTYYCNLSFDAGLQDIAYYQFLNSEVLNSQVETGLLPVNVSVDPTTIILDRIRQAMFLASIYEGSREFTNSWTYNYSQPTTFNSSNSTVQPVSPNSLSNTTIPTINASTNLPYPANHYFQTIPATQTTTRILYEVRVYLWGIALLVSWLIIIFVLPLFWGYWMLDREAGMTPADIARIFQSPLLIVEGNKHETRDEGMTTDEVVEKVGHRNLNDRQSANGPDT